MVEEGPRIIPVCLDRYQLRSHREEMASYGLSATRVMATQRFVTEPARVETAIGAGNANLRQYVSGWTS